MDKLNVQPVIGIVSKPMMGFKFFVRSRLFTIFAMIRLLQFPSFDGVPNGFARLFFQYIPRPISSLFHGLAEFLIWAFAVFSLIFSSVSTIFWRCITCLYSFFSMVGISILSYSFAVLSSCNRIFHSLARIVISTAPTVSRKTIGAVFVFRELIYRLRFSNKEDIFAVRYTLCFCAVHTHKGRQTRCNNGENLFFAFTVWVNTYFGFHGGNYITEKECAI